MVGAWRGGGRRGLGFNWEKGRDGDHEVKGEGSSGGSSAAWAQLCGGVGLLLLMGRSILSVFFYSFVLSLDGDGNFLPRPTFKI